jgi:uncharacterized protein YukE
MSRHHEHWQRSLDSLSRKQHHDPKDIQRGIREYTSRFRMDIKELSDKYGGANQREFQRSVEQLRNRFERDIEKYRRRMYPEVK